MTNFFKNLATNLLQNLPSVGNYPAPSQHPTAPGGRPLQAPPLPPRYTGPLQSNAAARPHNPPLASSANPPRRPSLKRVATPPPKAPDTPASRLIDDDAGITKMQFEHYVNSAAFAAKDDPHALAAQEKMQAQYFQNLWKMPDANNPIQLHFDDQGHKYFMQADDAPARQPGGPFMMRPAESYWKQDSEKEALMHNDYNMRRG